MAQPESTEALEQLIIARIKDNNFDDPVRKVRTKPNATTTVEVSSEKSKVGLAQIYEQEITAQSSNQPVISSEAKEIESKLHALVKKLDALVNI